MNPPVKTGMEPFQNDVEWMGRWWIQLGSYIELTHSEHHKPCYLVFGSECQTLGYATSSNKWFQHMHNLELRVYNWTFILNFECFFP